MVYNHSDGLVTTTLNPEVRENLGAPFSSLTRSAQLEDSILGSGRRQIRGSEEGSL